MACLRLQLQTPASGRRSWSGVHVLQGNNPEQPSGVASMVPSTPGNSYHPGTKPRPRTTHPSWPRITRNGSGTDRKLPGKPKEKRQITAPQARLPVSLPHSPVGLLLPRPVLNAGVASMHVPRPSSHQRLVHCAREPGWGGRLWWSCLGTCQWLKWCSQGPAASSFVAIPRVPKGRGGSRRSWLLRRTSREGVQLTATGPRSEVLNDGRGWA